MKAYKASKSSKKITNRESQSLTKYLQEISKIALLKPDEEAEIARQARMGNQYAIEKLIKANLRFVVRVAKKYQYLGIPLEDLINEGNIGLIKAIQHFDETKGFKFISYAVWWINQSILKAIEEYANIIRIPQHQLRHLKKIAKKFAELEQKIGREPSCEELAEILGISPDEMPDLFYVGRCVSLDAPMQEDEEDSLPRILLMESSEKADKPLMIDSLQTDITRILKQLEKTEATVLMLYFGLNGEKPLSLEEISQQFNISFQRIRQIKEKAVNRLRNKQLNRELRYYLG